MKIHMYNNDGTKLTAEVHTESGELPPVAYTFASEYRYYAKGSARNSHTYYEVEAIHVTEPTEENENQS